MSTENEIYVIGGESAAKEAIAKVFTEQGKAMVFIDEGDDLMKKELSAELSKNKEANYVQSIEPIKKLRACKGRHTYLNKGNGIWKCDCGKQLL